MNEERKDLFADGDVMDTCGYKFYGLALKYAEQSFFSEIKNAELLFMQGEYESAIEELGLARDEAKMLTITDEDFDELIGLISVLIE